MRARSLAGSALYYVMLMRSNLARGAVGRRFRVERHLDFTLTPRGTAEIEFFAIAYIYTHRKPIVPICARARPRREAQSRRNYYRA